MQIRGDDVNEARASVPFLAQYLGLQAHGPSLSRGPLFRGCDNAIFSNAKTKENLTAIA
jgi:hypothetical protein